LCCKLCCGLQAAWIAGGSGSNLEQPGDEGGLGSHVAPVDLRKLPLPHHRHHLVACQCSSCRMEAAEAEPRSDQAFHAPVVLFDGLIANDKFCLVRRSRLRLSWSRLALRERSSRASTGPALSLQSGGTDAMPVDRASDDAANCGRPASMGSGLPGGAGLDDGAGRRACRRVARPRRAGGWP